MCRSDAVAAYPNREYDGRWWEYQANLAIGGLLLPKSLVKEALMSWLDSHGSLGQLFLPENRKEQAARSLADIFNVNPVVAKIRISELFPLGNENQLTL